MKTKELQAKLEEAEDKILALGDELNIANRRAKRDGDKRKELEDKWDYAEKSFAELEERLRNRPPVTAKSSELLRLRGLLSNEKGFRIAAESAYFTYRGRMVNAEAKLKVTEVRLKKAEARFTKERQERISAEDTCLRLRARLKNA